MIRASVLNGVRYEAEFSPSEDYALWYRLIAKTRFYNIPKVLTKYRVYSGSTSRRLCGKVQAATKEIRALFEKEHPELCRKIKAESKFVVRMKLFGLIPLGKFTQIGETRRGALRFMPFVTCKAKLAGEI